MGWARYALIVVLCSLGHALIWVRVINWTHGLRSQRGLIKAVRFCLHTFLFAAPPAFLYFTWSSVPRDGWYALPGWLQLYLWITAAAGAIIFPLLLLQYWFKKPVAALHKELAVIHPVRDASGRRPTGSGRRAWMAHLPGNQAYEVELVEKEIGLQRLPDAWNGLRILHLSDLHFWGRPGIAYFEAVLAHCAQRPCDLLIITGDLVDSPHHYDWLRLLQSLSWTQGAFAIRGNHDARYDDQRVSQMLEQIGIEPLGGKARIVSVRDQPLLIAGNEAPWLLPVPRMETFDHFDGFRLAVLHSPDQYRWAQRHGFDLALAGHNHGGQIRVPGFGSIFVPSKTGRRYDMGLFTEGDCLLHVSKGISGGHPVRFFCRPEAVWLTLQPSRLKNPSSG